MTLNITNNKNEKFFKSSSHRSTVHLTDEPTTRWNNFFKMMQRIFLTISWLSDDLILSSHHWYYFEGKCPVIDVFTFQPSLILFEMQSVNKFHGFHSDWKMIFSVKNFPRNILLTVTSFRTIWCLHFAK